MICVNGSGTSPPTGLRSCQSQHDATGCGSEHEGQGSSSPSRRGSMTEVIDVFETPAQRWTYHFGLLHVRYPTLASRRYAEFGAGVPCIRVSRRRGLAPTSATRSRHPAGTAPHTKVALSAAVTPLGGQVTCRSCRSHGRHANVTAQPQAYRSASVSPGQSLFCGRYPALPHQDEGRAAGCHECK